MSNTSGDIQPIILAAGRGSRITQLLSGRPKCLLPIGNRPMIQYPLELLIRSNFKETFVIVLDNEEELIKSTIHKLNLDISIDYISIPTINDYATADSLRMIKDKIKKDLLIISCDIVTDLNLSKMIQQFRLKTPTFLCLLASIPSEKENLIPAKKLNDNKEFDLIGFDGNDSSRLVFFEPDIMFGETVPFKKSFLEKCPHFKMHSNYLDSHIYLFPNWILNYLNSKDNIKSIKGDFVPSVVRKQFRLYPNTGHSESNRSDNHHNPHYHHNRHIHQSGTKSDSGEKHFIDYLELNSVDKALAQLDNLRIGISNGGGETSNGNDQNDDDLDGDLDDNVMSKKINFQKKLSGQIKPSHYPQSRISCYGFRVGAGDDQTLDDIDVVPDQQAGYCIRANDWIGFCEANRIVMKRNTAIKVARSDLIQSYVDGMVASGTMIGEKCTIKRTIIGHNCKIGNKVKLTNCIVLDNVHIEDGCVLQGSLLCYDVFIGNNAEIKDCIVGPKQKIVALGHYTNESLTEEMLDF